MMTDNTTPAAKPARVRRAHAPTPASTPAAPPTSKSDTVIKLLVRARGATAIELIAATDWQPHSVRAFLSGLRKKGRVLIRKERKGGGFAYYMAALATAPAAPVDPLAQASAADDAPSAGGIA